MPELRKLADLGENPCPEGEEEAWLKSFSSAAREALHRLMMRDFDGPLKEMEALCQRLQSATQLHYFDKIRRGGGDIIEAGQAPPADRLPPSAE
jgi:hypothetical protein